MIVVCNASQNKHKIYLNEAFTRKIAQGDDRSQYIEILRKETEDEISLDGYAIIVAETSNTRKTKDFLYITSAVDLSPATMKPTQQYGLIGRSEQNMGHFDIIPFKPNPVILQTPANKQHNNWLSVEDDKLIVIFLVSSDQHKVFDSEIWPGYQLNSNSLKIKDKFQEYLLQNINDVLVIKGVSAPTVCKPISTMLMPEILNDLNAILTPDRTPSTLSIARCGVELNAFDLNVFKHDYPSPGEKNPCTGDKMVIDNAFAEENAHEYCSNIPQDVEDEEALGEAIEDGIVNPDEHCPPEDEIPSDAATLDIDVAVATEKRAQFHHQYGNRDPNAMDIDDSDDAVWNQVSLSDKQIQKIVGGHLHTIMPNENQLKKANKWLEFLADEHHGWNSRYRCRICHTYSKTYNIPQQKLPELAYSAGVMKKSKRQNTIIIKQHEERSRSHQKLLLQLKKDMSKKIVDGMSDIIPDKIGYEATNNHMRLGMISNFSY